MQPLQPITPPSPSSSFDSPTSLIPLFFLIYPSHSLSHPRYSPILSFPTLACFTSHLHQPSLNIPLPTIIKHLTLGSAAPPLQPPRLRPVFSAAWLCALVHRVGEPLWRPGPPGGLHCAVICVCNLWGISVNATLSGWKNLLAHSQFIESTKVQSASVLAFCSPSSRSFPVYKVHAKFKAWVGGGGRGVGGLRGQRAANSHCLGNMFRKHPNCLCNM